MSSRQLAAIMFTDIVGYTSLMGDDETEAFELIKQNRDLQTTRTFEIPACGAFMLAERTDEHLRLFEEGKEAAYFGSEGELLDKVRYYLDHEGERKTIAAAGRKRCLDSGYSHHDRLKYMLRRITETNDASR